MITLYIWDAQRIYSHSVEADPRGPMPASSTPTAPPETNGEQVAQWVGSCWRVLEERPAPESQPLPGYPALIASHRYDAEIAGIVWQGHGIATDRESQQKMSDERNAVKDGLRTDGKGWKCLDLTSGAVVFRSTSNAEILELTDAAYRHVSDCFDREGQLLAAVADGTFTADMLDQGWPG